MAELHCPSFRQWLSPQIRRDPCVPPDSGHQRQQSCFQPTVLPGELGSPPSKSTWGWAVPAWKGRE